MCSSDLRGPGLARTDLAIARTVAGSTGRGIEVRVELFNVWNQAQWRQPGNIIGSPTFGQITSADDGRTLQLALKYLF